MKGVIAAVPTPINSDGVPQKELFLEHCRWALENGCDGLNILGSTGEANSLDSTSRRRVMHWAAEGLPNDRLMVGTGTPSLTETIELTRHADDLGYKVALVLPPYYYKPASEQGLFDWYETIHKSLAGRDIAIYFYNFPQMTGIYLSVPLIESLHSKWPDRFLGIKDSSGDLGYCRDLVAAIPELKVFPSSEVSLAEANASGFAGCISATTNLTGSLSQSLWRKQGSPDGNLTKKVEELRNQIGSKSLIPSVKFLVGQRTKEARWENVCPPFTELTTERKTELEMLAPIIHNF